MSRGSMMPSSLTPPVASSASDSLSLGLDSAPISASSSSSNGSPLRRGRRAGDDRHHAGDLLRAHHGDLGGRPQEREPVAEGPARHAVGAGAVGRADDHREVRHRRVRDRVDHLRALLDDARAASKSLPDHVAGDVLQEHERHVDLVAELDEVRRLLGGLRVQHAVVAEDPRPGSRGSTPSRTRASARSGGLNSSKRRAVDDAGDDLAHVERLAQVAADDAEQLLGVVDGGSSGSDAGSGPACASSGATRPRGTIRRASISSTAR